MFAAFDTLNNRELAHLLATRNLYARDFRGQTVLHHAAATNNSALIECLCRLGGMDSNLMDHINRTPLHLAAVENNVAAARTLLECGADPNLPDLIGDTPLLWAAFHGHLELASLLIAGGADLEHRYYNGRTALLWAASCGHAEMVELLLQAGANLAAAGQDGRTVQDYSTAAVRAVVDSWRIRYREILAAALLPRPFADLELVGLVEQFLFKPKSGATSS